MTLSDLHQMLCESHGHLINQNNQHATKQLADKPPQTTKGVCYEYRAAELAHPCDFLVAYDTSASSIRSLEKLFYSSDNANSNRITDFLKRLKAAQPLNAVQLLWLSFDWSRNHYPEIPTFYVSTQHYSYAYGEKLDKAIEHTFLSLAPDYLDTAKQITADLSFGKLNHIGFTYARDALKAKFTITLAADEVIPLLEGINWQGDYAQLHRALELVKQLTDTIQISLSFDKVLSQKIELELPWVRNQSENYVNEAFIEEVIEICHAEQNYKRLIELVDWLENNPNDKAFYTKFSIFEDKKINLKSYLHSSPAPKRRFLG